MFWHRFCSIVLYKRTTLQIRAIKRGKTCLGERKDIMDNISETQVVLKRRIGSWFPWLGIGAFVCILLAGCAHESQRMYVYGKRVTMDMVRNYPVRELLWFVFGPVVPAQIHKNTLLDAKLRELLHQRDAGHITQEQFEAQALNIFSKTFSINIPWPPGS